MLCIKDLSKNYYFQNKGKIILFENSDDAIYFLQNFMNYAMQRATQENPMLIFEVMGSQNTIKIIESDFDLDKVETIIYQELMDSLKNKKL
jgi:hypothetical protein